MTYCIRKLYFLTYVLYATLTEEMSSSNDVQHKQITQQRLITSEGNLLDANAAILPAIISHDSYIVACR